MSSPTEPSGLPAVIVLVGDDAAGLGALARRLRDDHGARVGVFVAEPADEGLADAIAEMASELYSPRPQEAG